MCHGAVCDHLAEFGRGGSDGCTFGVVCEFFGTEVFQEFIAVDALDFLLRAEFFLFELVAEGAGERAPFDFPEFGDLDARWVHLEGGSHRREYGCLGVRGVPKQLHLVFEAVDGVDNHVVFAELEFVVVRFLVNILDCGDFCTGVDGEQPFAEYFYLGQSDRLCGGHELAIDVSDIHRVRIHDGQVPDT